MTNAITEARDELVAAYVTAFAETNVTVHDAFPDTVQPPAIVIEPDQPYVTPGATFAGSHDVHMVVFVLVPRFGKLEAVDELLVSALTVKHGWLKRDADRPDPLADRPDLLSTVITLSKTVYL